MAAALKLTIGVANLLEDTVDFLDWDRARAIKVIEVEYTPQSTGRP
jgi:hypothetical protein